MQDQTTKLEWRDGDVPVSDRFDDPYFSLENGWEETRHVFLGGNDLPGRFQPGFHIAELGFGTGLNLLTTLHSWRENQQTGFLYFTSFEAFPMSASDMVRAQSAFPELADIAFELAPFWKSGKTEITLSDLKFKLIPGDARETLADWPCKADAWYLDGFSPAKNPELWGAELMRKVFDHTAPHGTAATYTAAGFVRRNLADAGFEVERRAGFGKKRHMTVARKGTI